MRLSMHTIATMQVILFCFIGTSYNCVFVVMSKDKLHYRDHPSNAVYLTIKQALCQCFAKEKIGLLSQPLIIQFPLFRHQNFSREFSGSEGAAEFLPPTHSFRRARADFGNCRKIASVISLKIGSR